MPRWSSSARRSAEASARVNSSAAGPDRVSPGTPTAMPWKPAGSSLIWCAQASGVSPSPWMKATTRSAPMRFILPSTEEFLLGATSTRELQCSQHLRGAPPDRRPRIERSGPRTALDNAAAPRDSVLLDRHSAGGSHLSTSRHTSFNRGQTLDAELRLTVMRVVHARYWRACCTYWLTPPPGSICPSDGTGNAGLSRSGFWCISSTWRSSFPIS